MSSCVTALFTAEELDAMAVPEPAGQMIAWSGEMPGWGDPLGEAPIMSLQDLTDATFPEWSAVVQPAKPLDSASIAKAIKAIIKAIWEQNQ